MDDRTLQFRVGVLVLASAMIGILLIVYFGELPTFGRGEYEFHVRFPAAPGVAKDTPVRKHGVRIGRVEQVVLFFAVVGGKCSINA